MSFFFNYSFLTTLLTTILDTFWTAFPWAQTSVNIGWNTLDWDFRTSPAEYITFNSQLNKNYLPSVPGKLETAARSLQTSEEVKAVHTRINTTKCFVSGLIVKAASEKECNCYVIQELSENCSAVIICMMIFHLEPCQNETCKQRCDAARVYKPLPYLHRRHGSWAMHERACVSLYLMAVWGL